SVGPVVVVVVVVDVVVVERVVLEPDAVGVLVVPVPAPAPHELVVTSGVTRKIWIPACFNAPFSASLACWYGNAWFWPATCTPSWSIVTGTPPIVAEAIRTATLSLVVLPSFVTLAETWIPSTTIWPPPRLTSPRLDSPDVTR